jgi:hypothetical protein
LTKLDRFHTTSVISQWKYLIERRISSPLGVVREEILVMVVRVESDGFVDRPLEKVVSLQSSGVEVAADGVKGDITGGERGMNSFGGRVGVNGTLDWDVGDVVVVVVMLCVDGERDDGVVDVGGQRGMNSFGGRVGWNGLGGMGCGDGVVMNVMVW